MDLNSVPSVNLSSYLSDGFMDTLFDKVVGELSGVSNICFLLCGLFSFAYFANILMKTWAKGDAFDFSALLRPFIIGVITINFSCVYGLVDSVFSPINVYTEEIATSNQESLTSTREELERLKLNYQDEVKKANDENGGIMRNVKVLSSISDFFSNLYSNCIDLMLWGLEYIAGILFGAVKLVIRAVSLAFRIVLIVFGPFAFALSVLPIFKGNWKQWLSKYINVCLFIPIANLMDLIINQMHLSLINSHIEIYRQAIDQVSIDVNALDGTMTTLTISYIIFLLAFLVLYMMIPSIASYIVNSAGMESLTGGITLAGSAAASKMISGTVQNPLTPNILKLFRRKHWKQQWVEVVDSGSVDFAERGKIC